MSWGGKAHVRCGCCWWWLASEETDAAGRSACAQKYSKEARKEANEKKEASGEPAFVRSFVRTCVRGHPSIRKLRVKFVSQ